MMAVLLIEPFGIEIRLNIASRCTMPLLIEPFGIEIMVRLNRGSPRRQLLIEPFGIEIANI